MKHLLLISALLFLTFSASAQKAKNNFQFAQITDTHIGSNKSAEDLRCTVSDINRNDSIDFVIITGDVTEFGADSEFLLAKQILDSLNKPWHIIPGNHDAKWSESGGNSFRRIFGSETFSFICNNFLFIGTNSGPNMRMSPAQIPIENIVWLDSLLSAPSVKDLPVIYCNHYPPAEDINNWYEVIDRLKKHDIQLTLCGHGHNNKQFSSEGIPGLMCRSNLRDRDSIGGYDIMRVYGDTLLTSSVRKTGLKTFPAWAKVRLVNHHFSDSINQYPRPDFSMNDTYKQVREVWKVKEKSDIGAGVAYSDNALITTNTGGYICAYNSKNGKLLWKYNTGAKIYSTPAIYKKIVLGASTNGFLYALDIKTGELLWKFDTGEPVVASPSVYNDNVFIAGSWGKCYSLKINSGRCNWSNNNISGFVETIPRFYKGMILFGTWANHLYSLDSQTGEIKWDWDTRNGNRMLSPAACVPVAVDNKVFVVAPDRKMACLNAMTGKLLWHSRLGGKTVRESMGVSADSSLIFAKTMQGEITGVSVASGEDKIIWNADINTGYDIAPSVITEKNGIVFVPTDKGVIYAVDKLTGKLLWKHRISSCLINQILPINKNSIVCTSMDGVITRITFK